MDLSKVIGVKGGGSEPGMALCHCELPVLRRCRRPKSLLSAEMCCTKLLMFLLVEHNFLLTLLVMLTYHVLPTLSAIPVLCVLCILLRLDPHLER